jgi:hypothetical protein
MNLSNRHFIFIKSFFMDTENRFDKENVLKKITSKVPLTREEEYFYLTEVLGFPADEAGIMISTQDFSNKDKKDKKEDPS